jgi:predicted transcriptional regulator
MYYIYKARVLNEGDVFMKKMKKLPDAEFDIMKVVWANAPPMTTAIIMEQLGKEREWKIQTVVSLMLRLVERGFLRSEKHGKERTYFSMVSKEDYLRFETGNFIKQFHENSFLNLVTTLYDDKALTDKDIDELLKWVKERRG